MYYVRKRIMKDLYVCVCVYREIVEVYIYIALKILFSVTKKLLTNCDASAAYILVIPSMPISIYFLKFYKEDSLTHE